MPRNGSPAGSTPSDVSSARPPGIRPSPQALSTGVSRGSATITERPLRRACNAADSPPGPPPTTNRSASNTTVAQRFVLHPDPHGQQQGVGHGEAERGEPGGVDERQRDPLDDDGDVVGVVQPAVG